ncbi:hypothetical protein BYT27DRAFT_7100541 [Phlegmacium glaucopus]|nr:hypothetical protein BYT27DRAFT_7100541 [Phlegmacium glaucopus]
MEHLTTISTSWGKSFKIQHAADKGLEKLVKYSFPAKDHHSYIVGTILHPCLCSHWFAATVDPADSATQEEAIRTAEVIFQYIAETYLETPTSPASTVTVTPKPAAKPPTRTPSFLASACSFQRPITATSATTILKRTPKEELTDELDRYFRFEAAPMEQQEDSDGHPNGEPSAQEVLLNPLVWWKVNSLY